jgi:hypothetical protein
VDDIPEDVRKDLQIIFVSRIDEVIDAALEMLVANPPPPLVMNSAGGVSRTEREPLAAKD